MGLRISIKANPNAAILKVYNAAGTLKGTYNISGTYQNASRINISNSYSFITNNIVALETNDVVELTINVGKTPIVKKFKLDENLVNVIKNRTTINDVAPGDGHFTYLDRSGSRVIEAIDRSDLAVDPAVPCPPSGTKRYMLVRTYFRKLRLPNPDNPTDKNLYRILQLAKFP